MHFAMSTDAVAWLPNVTLHYQHLSCDKN